MTKPVKAKAVKPVKAWALVRDGKILVVRMTRLHIRRVKKFIPRTFRPVRVEIREVK